MLVGGWSGEEDVLTMYEVVQSVVRLVKPAEDVARALGQATVQLDLDQKYHFVSIL